MTRIAPLQTSEGGRPAGGARAPIGNRPGRRKAMGAEARAGWNANRQAWLGAIAGKYAPTGEVPAVQAKLEVSEPGDELEQEADRVADQVMRMPANGTAAAPPAIEGSRARLAEHQVQRRCTECEEEAVQREPADEPLQREADEDDETLMRMPTPTGVVQRACSECAATGSEDEEHDTAVQRAASAPMPQADGRAESDFHARLAGVRAGGGEALPNGVRSFMEPRFDRSFGSVRLYRDARANGLAASVQAKAFTHGGDLYFGSGEFQPGTESGRRLIAHELTHVVQQSGASAGSTLARQAAAPGTETDTAQPDAEAEGPSLIVDDEVAGLGTGQMNKTAFLAELREVICTTAEEALRVPVETRTIVRIWRSGSLFTARRAALTSSARFTSSRRRLVV